MINAKRLATRLHRIFGAQGRWDVFEVAAEADLVSVRRRESRLNLAALSLSPIND